MNDNTKSLRVLVVPLDWGLGHATRCIPIIGQLLHNGCEVVLAAEGAVARLLVREFPQLELKTLRGYRIKYGKQHLFLNILLQLPGIFKSIRFERKWLKQLLEKEKFDIIISDNRPGLYTKSAHCIYITHQLRIQSGISSWADDWLQKLHARYMKKFNRVWVPDAASATNLGGELSHPYHQLLPTTYLGLFSRLTIREPLSKKYDLLFLLSGPEPQRSLLEKKCLNDLRQFKGSVLMVRGLPGENKKFDVNENIKVEQHLNATDLQAAIQQSALVICRSGYTTLMDLMKLKKKALLIPTPGQTEQEYLAAYMKACSYFPYQLQNQFNVVAAVEQAQQFSFEFPFSEDDFEEYRDVVDQMIASVSKAKS